jgi:hypothetical protein
MKSLSLMRNDSSTAFLTQSFTTQAPSRFSATLTSPRSSCSMASMTASRTEVLTVRGVMSARCSKASTMTDWMSFMLVS